MELKNIRIEKFKKARDVSLDLGRVNYLVGGNNSGKSSILQAIHCSITAAQSQVRNEGATVLAEESLIYAPSSDFSLLGYRRPFENRADGHRAKITFSGEADDGAESTYSIQLYKGRNNKNVGIERSGRVGGFGLHIYSNLTPFSVFVPGLAGVSHFEEFKTEAYVFRRIAGGESNLYLRNVLLILKENGQLNQLTSLLRELFPELKLLVNFESKRDLYIDVKVQTDNTATMIPIDLVGTGVLQAIQIFAYATLANPTLLLLDEPDSHLHPSNQTLLSKAFEILTERTGTKIILATHSRHLINAAPEDAKFFWVDNGTIKQNDNSELIKLLMEIGILDDADSIIYDNNSLIIATEDEKSNPLRILIKKATNREFNIIKLKGVTNSEIAQKIFEQLIPYIPGNPKFIFHRDRDFMTDDEVNNWKERFESDDIRCFVTAGSDVESYYLNLEHLAEISNLAEADITNFINDILQENADEIRSKFRNKRQDINLKFHRDGGGPHTNDLLAINDLTTNHAVGKFLIKKIRANSAEALGIHIDPICPSNIELAPDLRELIDSIFENN